MIETIKQFVNDMIHMTEGEKLIKYWWLWLIASAVFIIVTLGKDFIKPKRHGL
jgi:hypothetical protein